MIRHAGYTGASPACETVRMTVPFATSARSSVGIEWEVMLADGSTGDLIPRAPDVMQNIDVTGERFTVTQELLTNTIEVTSGIGATVAEAVHDLVDAIGVVREVTEPEQIELLSAGSHPFAQWYNQTVTDKTRYHSMIERTQWWGRNMMIWGIHVHIGVEDVTKVMPIINALSIYLPHLQALSASSPFWAGERTGYASNRALVFQQLPTAGLPWPLKNWAEFESYLDDMVRTGVISEMTEVRWDIRPAPQWGTIEVRACDGMSTVPELAAVAALVQVLVEHFSRALDQGKMLPSIQPWFSRENKWRAARYGLDATSIIDSQGTQVSVRDHVHETMEQLAPIAEELNCAREFSGLQRILSQGTSSARQLEVADLAGGDLREVVMHLIREFRAGPTLKDHLAALPN